MSWINICDIIYPVGCIYTSADSTPPAELFGGTWTQIGNDRVLMNTTTASKLGTTINSGLPNITGNVAFDPLTGWTRATRMSGAFYGGSGTGGRLSGGSVADETICIDAAFSASKSNSIYGASTIVQPPAYYVYMWRRTA